MKTKKTILSLAISALLMAGVASYPLSSYAKEDEKKADSGAKKVEEKKKEVPKADSSKSNAADSDKRSSGDSGNKSHQKITVCHVPPGNPAQKHTIHIAFSAWAAHKLHTNKIGPDYADYLGSCNSKTTTTAKETLHVISGCTGATREALETKVQSYFEPITVADTALDDETIHTAMSQCLDKGDSSDSGHDDHGAAKGGGHDSVSDSGKHHRIRGCQNKDSGHKADSSKHTGRTDSDKEDGNKNHHKKLKDAVSDYNTAHNIKDPIIVSDSSLDDSGANHDNKNTVFAAYKACTQDASNANKIDSSKVTKKKGDSGHRQQILRETDSVSDSGKQHHKSCTAAQDTTLRAAITAYKAKTSTKDLILTATAYNDISVKAAIDACVTAGAKDTVTDSFSPNVAIRDLTINGATVTNAVVTGNTITGGTITAGTGSGTSTTANVIGGTISGGIVSGGTTSGTTLTGATITGATVFTGVSGRLNFRENTSPIKDTVTQ
ncbi:MAG: hypothetical protein ACXW1W_09530 [Methylococcaceae bacterium]